MRSLINIRRMIFGVVLVCVLGLPAYGQYCSASGGSSGCYEYISRVQVGTIDNSTSQNCGYADHTSLSTTMEIGTGYSITVNNGDPWSGDQCGIWVDWNADEDFDDVNETIVMSGGPGTFTGTITPPADAVVGNTRLRIRIRYTGTLDPCGDTPWGEVEDYTITIPPNEDCDTIAIGSGTSVWAYPMYTYYHDSRTQVIYLASEIGSEGTITALGLDVATVPGQIMNNWTIRMKHTTMSSYSTASLDATGWTIVYQGNEPIGITGWRTFNFSTPFEYNGSDNLLVDFSHNNTSYSTYGMCRSSAPGGTRSAYARSDSGYGDPLNWSGTTSPTVYGTTSIPNVKLTICQETSPTVNISGYVKTAQGVRIKGAIVSASTGPNTVTDALGHYMLTLPSPFSGTITAAQTDWTFDARLYLGQTSDLVDENLTGTYNVGYGGGSGTSSSPYLIYNAAQLNAIGAKALDWGKYFRLMADIDLSGYDGKEGRPSFNRIGYYINFVGNFAFTGVFDGYGHTISNFTFDSDAGNDGVGIFGYMNASGAQVKNVKLINVDVNSTSYIGTGGLVGYILNGMVSGCSVQGGIVSAVDDVGGLAGMVWEGTISDCNVAVGVSGEWSVGGLLGGTGTGGVVSDCRASCTVTGKVECGGLIGDIGSDNGTAIRCSTAGDVMINYGSILDRTAGGIAGSSSGTVRYCYSTANVIGNGANEIGGLVGRNAGGSISNCYASGAATGKTYIGGLIGVCWDSNIVNCYSVGPVSGTGSYEGGLIGEDVSGNSQVIGSFWDKQTSGLTTSAGGTGKTTAEMQTEATFLAAGWDFEIETANGNETIWYIEPNDYPRLCWEAGIKYGGGTGEPDDPYLIYTSEQMNEIGTDSNDWRKSFKLMADISLSAYGGSLYNIIGRSSSPIPSGGPFYGTFDGNYHSISGFSYSRNSINYVGIFGYVGDKGTIRNLRIISPSLTDAGFNDMTYVGPIAGYADGANISGCAVTGGTVQGKNYVGGLVGLSAGSYMVQCSSSASVSGGNYIGGLVGGPYSLGSLDGISDCYARGNVSGTSYVGGFIGDSSDEIIVNCYSTGLVSGTSNAGGFSGYDVNQYLTGDNVSGCFWDVESSGEPNSAAGTGLTTAQMYDVNTFIDTGWDFVDELDNGGSDDWAMPAGGGYPVLWYELPVAPNLPSFAGGSGAAEDPYLIGTESQLANIGHNARLMDKHFKLISDLDLNGLKYYMIAEKPYAFEGTFDGDGHTISNVLIEPVFTVSSVGLIGTLKGPGASIQNLTLIDPNIVADWGWGTGSLAGTSQSGTITNCHAVNTRVWGLTAIGGLVGINYSYSTISDCSATGDVLENNTFLSMVFSAAGGLVGENIYWSEIENSSAKCNILGEDCLGGLVGTNAIGTIITNCYSQGTVTGTEDYIGGLIGRNLGFTSVNYCYSSSDVNGPTGTDAVGGFMGKVGTSGDEYYMCFWDSDVNPDVNGIGNTTDPNVIGKTTMEMQTRSTFTNAGWDFAGEVINGPNDIWDICEGTNYPKFVWQIPVGDFVCPDGVTFADYSVFGAAWLSEAGFANWDPNCDISEPNDNVIDERDLAVFCENWLAGL